MALFVASCSISPSQPKSSTSELAQQYFDLYAERKQFDKFLDMYSTEIVLEDVVYGSRIIGKDALHDFFRWNSGDVTLLEDVSLRITKQVIQDNIVVTTGYFTQFEYQGEITGPWRFTIWLEFDQHGKIIKQSDWINYTPKGVFQGGKNLNE